MRRARCFWEPELPADTEPERLKRLEQALKQKAGFLRTYVHSYIEQKRAARLEFVSVTSVMPSYHTSRLQEALAKAGPITAPDLLATMDPDDPRRGDRGHED